MTIKNKNFHLRIIDLKDIVTHEEFDPTRYEGLVKKIKDSQLFINPILVANVDNHRYMQIDGMNRYSALMKLGIPSILAQVIDYNDKWAVDLTTWCHLNHFSKDDFLKKISAIKEVQVSVVGFKYLRKRYMKNRGMGFLCAIAFRDGTIYRVAADGDLIDKINTLRKITKIYKNDVSRDVLPEEADSVNMNELFKKDSSLQTLVIFPSFNRDQVIEAAVYKGVMFPGGVTRFVIKNRCLNVDLPLDILKSKKTAAEKNVILEKYLEEKKHRTYDEPTVYFEP